MRCLHSCTNWKIGIRSMLGSGLYYFRTKDEENAVISLRTNNRLTNIIKLY